MIEFTDTLPDDLLMCGDFTVGILKQSNRTWPFYEHDTVLANRVIGLKLDCHLANSFKLSCILHNQEVLNLCCYTGLQS